MEILITQFSSASSDSFPLQAKYSVEYRKYSVYIMLLFVIRCEC